MFGQVRWKHWQEQTFWMKRQNATRVFVGLSDSLMFPLVDDQDSRRGDDSARESRPELSRGWKGRRKKKSRSPKK